MHIDISQAAEGFPEFRVAVVIATGLSIHARRPADLDQLINQYEIECRKRWAGMALSEIPGMELAPKRALIG